MNLRTELNILPQGPLIALSDPVFFIGSCFSENIGRKLECFKFKTLVNPFGTLYNPYSILHLIEKSASGDWKINENEIIFNQGVYRCLDFHSAISSIEKDELLEMAKKAFRLTSAFLGKSKWIVITFGTSFVYLYKETGKIAANCHKLPATSFHKKLLTVKEICDQFEIVHSLLAGMDKDMNIILTVSPVRHLKEGLEENQVSKSVLRLASSQLVSEYKNVFYFPAYEIMMDDLRDYRFYEEDLVHPAKLAVEYIWEKFCGAFMEVRTRDFMRDWNKILKAIHHRPFHPGTAEHERFIRQTIEKLKSFKDTVDIEDELKMLTAGL